MKQRTKEDRQNRIVEILSLLHEGGSFEEAKQLFIEEFDFDNNNPCILLFFDLTPHILLAQSHTL